ncbi:hypothetical protein KQX54_012142 [Cotesia glomerata]|uniref:Uncharacterized protein n=1 Tax=Cotesia glomerata TaxID=32391 RepID=A0AAV7IV43_COTGL|nr:hypothetical protein KQX54_012142 [Cotesia glomerata]
MASGLIHSILVKAKPNSLSCSQKLFDSMAAATFLYAAPIWAIPYRDLVERNQTFTKDFLVRHFGLRRTTSGALIRIRVLQIEEDRLRKACLKRKSRLLFDGNCHIASITVKTITTELLPDLSTLNPRTWTAHKTTFFDKYKAHLMQTDNHLHENAHYLQNPPSNMAKNYLNARIAFQAIKLILQ